MNDSELAHFSALILARLDELANSTASGKSAQAVVELDQQAVGRLSRMDALQNQAMAKAHQASRDLERRRLTAALNRIRDGEYGFCEDCGEEVPVGRLKLDLAATKCVSCASG
ncbi:TraR/DksA C4-type zinc finger protein [Ruegeria sp. HU-ET01832]|uniref:TraR/DksA family transcriptional regulator n=1 Tax=Ruegeria sp. HU-ET01832 TaxID=3135906 RepID=UPI00333FC47F